MSTPRLNKRFVVLGSVALSLLACGGASKPDLKSAFAHEEPRMTPAQREELRSAEQELARAKAASEEAKRFKQSVTEEQVGVAERSSPRAAGAKASGPREVIVTEETLSVTESVPPPKQKPQEPGVAAGRGTAAAKWREADKPEGLKHSRTKRSVEMREGNAVVVERRVSVRSEAAGAKGSSLERATEATGDEGWSAKNRFADEQFKLRQAEERAAEARLAATRASIERERSDDLHWEGRAASVKRLHAAKAESKAWSEVDQYERRVESIKAGAEQSYRNWQEADH